MLIEFCVLQSIICRNFRETLQNEFFMLDRVAHLLSRKLLLGTL